MTIVGQFIHYILDSSTLKAKMLNRKSERKHKIVAMTRLR